MITYAYVHQADGILGELQDRIYICDPLSKNPTSLHFFSNYFFVTSSISRKSGGVSSFSFRRYSNRKKGEQNN